MFFYADSSLKSIDHLHMNYGLHFLSTDNERFLVLFVSKIYIMLHDNSRKIKLLHQQMITLFLSMLSVQHNVF